AQTRARLAGGHALHSYGFAPRVMPRDDGDRRAADAERAGKKPNALVVRFAVDGRRREPNFQCVPLKSNQFRARGSRLDAHREGDGPIAFVERDSHHNREMNPCRIRATRSTMSIAKIGEKSTGPKTPKRLSGFSRGSVARYVNRKKGLL